MIHAGAGIAAIVLVVNAYAMFDNYVLLLQRAVSLLALQIPAILVTLAAAAGLVVTLFSPGGMALGAPVVGLPTPW